jgi:phage tail sheath protein FI
MPVTPTYPGVYIEEIPSGVHTITAVATSIGAFVDYFPQGPMNEAVEIFSWADFERQFGGLDNDSEASYAIQQFFLNGGTTAYVVRTTSTTSANAATTAAIVLQDGSSNNILTASALTPGQWGNNLRITIDYGTTDPTTLFNLTVTELSFSGSTPTVVSTETYRNLCLDSTEPNYAIDVINNASQLISVRLIPAATTRPAQTGSVSKPFTEISLPQWVAGTAFALGAMILDANGNLEQVTTAGNSGAGPGQPAWPTTLGTPTLGDGTVNWKLVATGVGVLPSWAASHAYTAGTQIFDGNWNVQMVTQAGTSGAAAPAWSTSVAGPTTDNAVKWKLMPTGAGLVLPTWNAITDYPVNAEVVDSNGNLQRVTAAGTSGSHPPAWATTIGGATNGDGTVNWQLVAPNRLAVNPTDAMQVSLNGGAPFTQQLQLSAAPAPAAINFGWIAATLQTQLRTVDPSLVNATVTVVGSASTEAFLQFEPGTVNPADYLAFSEVGTGTLATTLGIIAGSAGINVQEYALGSSTALLAQALPGGVASPGSNGQWEPDTDAAGVAGGLIGDQVAKTGMFALLDADIFNILSIPVTALMPDTDAAQVAINATFLCTQRRAFYILDVPQVDGDRDTVTGIQNWLSNNATLRSRNAALYFPRVDLADPLNQYRLRTTAPSGTMAGLYARIDVARGVWKAPAGTEAGLTGIQALEYNLIDGENGVLNPLAINCLRSFPVYGLICWGARTLFGADQLADDYKYIPVRRFTLFLEESLYRGTKWAVFEPNDEPLWAAIRLNVGAFMQTLFRQGAFQGSSPRDAYFVKCDSTTTTQTDIDNGIVNIVVGFAPLKPAEFVILQIQQIAGQTSS